MATEHDAQVVEESICYSFASDRSLLFEALTAAGSVEEHHDGNRRLAQLGASLSGFLLDLLAYKAHANRGKSPLAW